MKLTSRVYPCSRSAATRDGRPERSRSRGYPAPHARRLYLRGPLLSRLSLPSLNHAIAAIPQSTTMVQVRPPVLPLRVAKCGRLCCLVDQTDLVCVEKRAGLTLVS